MSLVCILCDNDKIEEKSELITDEFLGDSFIYTEVFCECIECGYHFVTAEMSTTNLESRLAGKQVQLNRRNHYEYKGYITE